MKLLPALKQKKRYIVFEIKSKETFSSSEIKQAVDDALLLFLGQLGLSKSSPLFVKSKGNTFMLKVNHNWVDEIKSALILIKSIKKKPVIVHSITTGGTIKKANTYM